MIETIYSELSKLPYTGSLLFLFLIFLAIYFHRRSGSSYAIMSRFYTLMTGGNSFHDDTLQEFWKRRQDIERFNALFNVKAKTILEAKKFKSWIEMNEIDVREISNANSYFDFSNMSIKRVKRREIFFDLVFLIAWFLASSFSLGLGTTDYAIVKFKSDNQWFGLNQEEAVSTFFGESFFYDNDWVINKKLCDSDDLYASQQVVESELKRSEIDFICRSFVDESLSEEVSEIKSNQSKFIFLSIIFFSFSFLSFSKIWRLKKIKNSRPYLERLKKSKAE